MAIWPPEIESGTAIRWQLTQKPSHSPGVVRLRLRRFVMCVSRCITAPWMWRNLDVGPEWQKILDEPLLITEEWRWVWWVCSYPAGCGWPWCSGLDWGGSLKRDLRWMKESGTGLRCCWGYSEDCWRSSNHVLHPEVKERNYGTVQVILQLMATGTWVYLLAPPSGQLLLCRCFFCWWCLCFGPFVWVEADFPHLRTINFNSIQPQTWTVFILWLQDKQKVELIYLFIPPLPPLLCRHGWSCACCIWVKVVMKLLAWMLEDAHVPFKTPKEVNTERHILKVWISYHTLRGTW